MKYDRITIDLAKNVFQAGLVKGSKVNSMTLDLPTGRKLADTPDIMEAFLQVRGEIDAIRSGQAMTLVSAPAPAEDGAPILVADGSPPAP